MRTFAFLVPLATIGCSWPEVQEAVSNAGAVATTPGPSGQTPVEDIIDGVVTQNWIQVGVAIAAVIGGLFGIKIYRAKKNGNGTTPNE